MPASVLPQDRYFFIHLHKTGGTSITKMLWRLFAPEDIYPNAQDRQATRRAYPDLTPELHDLLHLDPERLERIRLLCGHYPFLAGELLPTMPRYLVFLRHPVDRTISHLRHARYYVPALHNKSLAEILDRDRENRLFFRNQQTVTFSYHSFEEACRVDNCVRADPERLEKAKQNLLKCDFVGITESFATSVWLCEAIFQWNLGDIPHENVTIAPTSVSRALRERIAEGVTYDLEFYDFACQIHQELLAKYLPAENHSFWTRARHWLEETRRVLGAGRSVG